MMSTAIKDKCANIHHFYQPKNMYDLCSKLEIPIVQADLIKWRSFLQFHYNQYIIHLNDQSEYKETAIAKEIGHFFLHSHTTQFKISSTSISLTKHQKAEGILFATLLITDDAMYHLSSFNTKNARGQS
ncbi:hypothetical protein [Salicibibacter kimchii]|uniref:ImmA/IrrE family metallo-endopeptidase n=1 Tax=Salicibibacter kimchii TaxID=2099786 RepID=A0A345C2C2_9BACI|nr:hypothetical protein [Salicibibacter kimchii]AXF57353.1 hypothetical protein DT065_16035 [Salicibibacter kimchii]